MRTRRLVEDAACAENDIEVLAPNFCPDVVLADLESAGDVAADLGVPIGDLGPLAHLCDALLSLSRER